MFVGLMEVMATELRRKEDGKGNQNFPYPPAYEELCQIIRDISPQAYRSLEKHLRMPTIRGLQCVIYSNASSVLVSQLW